MIIDQIRKTDTTNDISRDVAAVVDEAHEAAKQIVAKARYDAFRMVTDAREEAESILAEADHGYAPNSSQGTEITHDGEFQTANEALAQVNTTLQEANSALAAENQSLDDRVQQTRALLTDLETRLARIAATPDPVMTAAHADGISAAWPQPIDACPPPPAVEPGRKAMRATATPSQVDLPTAEIPLVDTPTAVLDLDYSPSVPPLAKATEPSDDAAPQDSFYSRRSAKLPHIGERAGEDSFSAIRSMRAGLE